MFVICFFYEIGEYNERIYLYSIVRCNNFVNLWHDTSTGEVMTFLMLNVIFLDVIQTATYLENMQFRIDFIY